MNHRAILTRCRNWYMSNKFSQGCGKMGLSEVKM